MVTKLFIVIISKVSDYKTKYHIFTLVDLFISK